MEEIMSKKEEKRLKVPGSWIPVTRENPFPRKSRVGNTAEFVPCLDSTCVDQSRELNNWDSAASSWRTKTWDTEQLSVASASGKQREGWNCIPFTQLLALADCSASATDGLNVPRMQHNQQTFQVSHVFVQFAPCTPYNGRKRKHNQPSDVLNQRTNQETHLQSVFESSPPAIDKPLQPSSALSTCTELGKGEKNGVDLIKTPNQKPKKKKYRPRVVMEGNTERKKTRRVNKKTRSTEAVVEHNDSNQRAGVKSCKMSLNFDLETQLSQGHAKTSRHQNEKIQTILCTQHPPLPKNRRDTLSKRAHSETIDQGRLRSFDLCAPHFKPLKVYKKRRTTTTITKSHISTNIDVSIQVIEQIKTPIADDVVQRLDYPSMSGESKMLFTNDQNSVVPFKGDGIYSRKKKQARAKVDLDLETERVWKVLMSKEASDGAEATDANKENWWEEERKVFRGRASSFIGLMHMIQGDRRFSQWKGSVLDSVIGVFLTQNVSDHLSSSAFMSLAARFPLKPMRNDVTRHEGTEVYIEEPEEEVLNLNNTQWSEEMPPDSHDIEYNEMGNNNESLVHSTNPSHEDIGNTSKPNGNLARQKHKETDWDDLRKEAYKNCGKREKNKDTMDSLDWEAVRIADVNEIANAIAARGQNNRLAQRIKNFLNRLVREHGSIDLEWLRDVAPDKAKDFLLSVYGLGLKSVECVRLLTLHHLAFPVDTNVARIAVRLGWVPLRPLPESLQLHLLEQYPVMASIQKYLWPRLCTLDQRTLYELHYQLITFGKVFCTKIKPNCNACPMRAECRHFASEFASTKLSLSGVEEKGIEEKGIVTSTIPSAKTPTTAVQNLAVGIKSILLPPSKANMLTETRKIVNNSELFIEVPALPEPDSEIQNPVVGIKSMLFPPPKVNMPTETRKIDDNRELVVEVPASPEPDNEIQNLVVGIKSMLLQPPKESMLTETRKILENSEPVIEEPASPEHDSESDIEDSFYEDPDEIPTIKLNMEEFALNLQNYIQEYNIEVKDGDVSKALVALNPEAASIQPVKLKNVGRLRTEHQVYELPDSHPLLTGVDKRVPDEVCSYLFAIWTPGETSESIQPPKGCCDSQMSGNLCGAESCFSCNSKREANSQTVRGTLLIPCKTAMRKSFPLNGTYFQVNEVFADHDSSLDPINVPRDWLWNLPKRTVYFGTSIPSIFKGQATEQIQSCFWRGYVCLRGFDRKNCAPRPLMARLHFPSSKLASRRKAEGTSNQRSREVSFLETRDGETRKGAEAKC